MSRRILVVLTALALSGCGGSSAVVAPTPAVVQASSKAVQVQFSITIPRRPSGTARAPRYVSASTQSASIVVGPSGGPAGTPVVVNCTTVCSGQIAAPVGSDAFTVKLFDAASAGGNVLSTGSLVQTIVIDQANTVSVTFNGVVASLALSLSPIGVQAGVASTVTVNVAALDADKNTIVGPGSYVDANGSAITVQLADSDTSGATRLSTTALTAPPVPAVTLTYSGASIAAPTITASATGLTSGQASLAIMHNTITEFPTVNISPGSIITGPDGNLWFTEGGCPQQNAGCDGRIGRLTPSGTLSEFATPTKNNGPGGIITGPDGNLWFVETNILGLYAGKIGRVTPAGIISEFATPTVDSNPSDITSGPDGNLWFTENYGSSIGRVTLTGAINEYATLTPQSGPSSITTGPDGSLWFTEYNVGKIGRVTPAGVITEFATSSGFSGPGNITTGPDGNLWFTESYNYSRYSRIGMVTPAGVITEYGTPTANAGPHSLITGPDGNLWFLETGAVARITTAGTIAEFATPTANTSTGAITNGPDGNLWFTEYTQVARVTPSGTITEFPIPTPYSEPLGITTGPDHNLWFTELLTSKVGRITPY